MRDADLRRAKDMPGGMEAHRDTVDRGLLAELRRLHLIGEVFAVAQRHDVQRLAGGHHRAMSGARVIGMAVRDQGAGNRPHRIDKEITRRAVQSFRAGSKEVVSAHPVKIGLSGTMQSPVDTVC